MKKKVIIILLVIAGIVALGLTAHMINLIDIIKRMHGG